VRYEKEEKMEEEGGKILNSASKKKGTQKFSKH